MKLRRVKPTDIEWPEVRVTAQFDEELYQQFKNSLKAVGQIAPVICYEVEGKLWGCDGKHRCDEAIARGEPGVDVVVIPGDMVDVLTKNIFLDHLHGKPAPSQMVKVMKLLYQDYNLDPDQIEEKTGLTRNYIEKLIKISQSSLSVQEALDQGVIGVGHAYELSRLPYAIQQDEVIAKHQVWKFSVPELRDQVNKVLEMMEATKEEKLEATPTGPKRVVEYHCEGCKDVIEPRYLRPVMLCPDCFGGVWRLAKAKVKPEVTSQEQGEGA